MESNFVFKDRQSDHSNRRKITIVQHQGNEMLVDIERADTNVTEQGTPLQASILNEWNETVKTAKEKSENAERIAQTAVEDCAQAVSDANNAVHNVEVAIAQAVSDTNNAVHNVEAAIAQANSAYNKANALTESIDTSQVDFVGTPRVELINNADGTKRFSFKNLKGQKGDKVFIRYSFDKTSMTEQPTEETVYIGFYCGQNASTNVNDYSWSKFFGVESISATDYAQLVINEQVNPEQLYFIEGASDNQLVVTVKAASVAYSNINSGMKATTMQAAIDELKKNEFSKSYLDLTDAPTNASYTLSGLSEKSYNSLTDKPTIPTNESFRLDRLSEKSYNSLTDKPTIPTNESFRLDRLSERSYNSLTDKPAIPTNESFRLDGLSERSYNSLTDKPVIPSNASFTLAGLSEKSYNSLTDKPSIPVIDKTSIATALGLSIIELDNLVNLSKIASCDGQKIVFNADYIDIQ